MSDSQREGSFLAQTILSYSLSTRSHLYQLGKLCIKVFISLVPRYQPRANIASSISKDSSPVVFLLLIAQPPSLALGHSVFTIKLMLLSGRTSDSRVRPAYSIDFRGLRFSQLKKSYFKRSILKIHVAFPINITQHNSGQSRTQDRARIFLQKNVIPEVVCGILRDEELIKCTVVRQNKLTGP